MAEELATDLQRLAHQLHPSILEHVGLEVTVWVHVPRVPGESAEGAEICRGHGLTSMAEQAKGLQGTFRVMRQPEEGTEIHA